MRTNVKGVRQERRDKGRKRGHKGNKRNDGK